MTTQSTIGSFTPALATPAAAPRPHLGRCAPARVAHSWSRGAHPRDRTAEGEGSRSRLSAARPGAPLLGPAALLFAASAVGTIAWCRSMAPPGGMRMPGGWTMSMAWMRMPGQTWSGAAATFLGMWVVMMVAMMLPSLVPMLWRYRRAVGAPGERRLGRLTALVCLGYFFVWTVLGMAVFPAGAALAAVEMRHLTLARAVPMAVGLVVLAAGALQLTAWKVRQLACCREVSGQGRTLPGDARTAWRHGLDLGLHCIPCCAGPTAVLLAVGVMDLRAMAVVAAAVSAERVAPAGERVARATGVVAIGAGLLLVARAAGLR